MGIASGAFDCNTMIRRTVTQMTNSGLRTVDYASGRTDRVDVAARRAILTGLSQLSGKISDDNAVKLQTDYFEIQWHAGARPTHQVWQGRVWSRKELVDVCGLGTVTGLLGANCYHSYYPFIPGVSERMYPDEWLKQMNIEENTPKSFMGKDYTAYEARQRQRYLERCMRAQREKVELLKAGGADDDDVMLARCKYQAMLDEYKRFSKAMKLPEQRERIYYDLRGRIAPTQKQMREFFARQAEKKAAKQTEADKHKERAEEARREDMEKKNSATKQTGGKETGGHHYPVDKEQTIRDQLAAKAYEKFSREDDSKRIADNTGFSQADIERIRSHIFSKKHDLYKGYTRFEPDYDMAVAWQRLRDGDYLPRDITLLKHELLERELEKKYNINISEAHALASESYDWWGEVVKELGEGGEPDGLLQFD